MSNKHKPQWIAKVYDGKPGRDHLGLGSVSSDRILPSLSPSINVLTYHPRYYSFYVFLLDEFWRNKLPRSQSSWEKFFRPHDFIFSLGAHMCLQKEHGLLSKVVGARKTQPLANEERKYYSYDPKNKYINAPLGGYGLYYRTVMIELGLVIPGGKGFDLPVDVPTELGKQIADSFRSAVSNTRYYKEYFNKSDEKISINIIREYIHKACLCQLQRADAPDRPYLVDVFLHKGENADARLTTFRMFLDIAEQNSHAQLDQDNFRQLIYFRKTNEGNKYVPAQEMENVALRWRLYQAREYYSFALNALWYYLCDWGVEQNGDIYPVALNELWMHVEKLADFKKLARRLGVSDPKINANSLFEDLLTWIVKTVGSPKKEFDLACTIKSPINEHLLVELATSHKSSPDVMIAGMLVLLGLVMLRFNDVNWRRFDEWEIARMGEEQRLSMDGFLRKIEAKRKNTGVTILEIIRWIFLDDVIQQHERIANNKLPENTFRFWREGDALRFQKIKNEIGFMNSRFEAISTTIHELGLCGDFSNPPFKLTPDGRKLLKLGEL